TLRVSDGLGSTPCEAPNAAVPGLRTEALDPLIRPVGLTQRLPDEVGTSIDPRLLEGDVRVAHERVHPDYTRLVVLDMWCSRLGTRVLEAQRVVRAVVVGRPLPEVERIVVWLVVVGLSPGAPHEAGAVRSLAQGRLGFARIGVRLGVFVVVVVAAARPL